jgi:hypothetical protein
MELWLAVRILRNLEETYIEEMLRTIVKWKYLGIVRRPKMLGFRSPTESLNQEVSVSNSSLLFFDSITYIYVCDDPSLHGRVQDPSLK